MSEIKLNAGNWLGSEDGKVTKTVTLTSESAETVTEGESLIIKAGTLIQDSSMGYGLLLRDVDVTDGPRVAQLMIRGKYLGSKLPYELSGEEKTALAQIGMFDVDSTEAPAGEGFRIVNNSSVSVEMYYEIDKDEYGNTVVNPGSSATISIDYQYPYYLRYSSDASGNTQIFKGVYQGSSYNGSVGYYDENIQPPEAIGSDTEWRFNEGDNGTLTITGASGPQYTLHYELGSYADSHDEDKLPSDVTAIEGETVYVDFSTYPAPLADNYDFIGWATTDGQSIPEYSENGTNSITMYNDVTLYPVYAVHIATDYLAIDNTYGSSSILVEWYDEDKATWKTSMEVSSNGYEDFEYHTDRVYKISFSNGNFQDCVFTGELNGNSYVNEPCLDGSSGVISAPGGNDWIFSSGVYYLTVSQPSLENKFTIVNNSNDTVEVYYENDKSEYGNTFISGGSSATITIDAQYPYYARYNSGGNSNSHWFNGVYQGSSFDGSIGYYDGNIQPPNAVGSITEWQFYNNDYGTLTITYSK